MKKFFSILFLIPLLSFSQYPSWFPNEFKNKIFCGEFDCSGTYLGRTNYNTVPYKLHISESGIFVEINPGEFYTVQRGVEHKPIAKEETHLLLFEPLETKHTGDVVAEMSVEEYEEI